ncbi:hypothetical protein PIB30_075774 [Stylosanthes scabra]|uniref:Uncharacterized protein n=1 Tax=Stylosanthes scabra TaxID=79078 RepID=A0ABU6VPT5_9FABA|nr:hypothetical protein [Stylosanthes scabra]
MQESFYFEQGANPIVIKKTFDYRMGRILQQMLRKREVRNKFATDEGFERRSATNKVNWASAKGGSLHCGGSAAIPSTQERMSKELNREPTIAEVFKQTHTKKRNKEEWDVFIIEFDTRTQATQQSAHEGNGSSSPIIVDPDEVWREVVGEPRKNCIYGIGSYFSRTLCTDPLLRSSRGMSEPPLSQHTVEELRTQIHGLTQELHQKVQQNEENEERIQHLLIQAELKMNVTVEQAREELVREREELMREREEYRKMREEMAAYYASMRATGSGVGSTTVTAPAAQHDGDGGQEEEEDNADDYQDP